MCLDFILLLKADISSSRTALSPLLVHRQGRHTFLFFFYFPSPILFAISIRGGRGVRSHSIYRDEYIRWKGGESRTRSKNPFCFESIRAQIEGGGIYCVIERTYIRAWRRSFSHISFFLPLTPFLPIISFLLGIRLDGRYDRYVLCVPSFFLPSRGKGLGVKSFLLQLSPPFFFCFCTEEGI